MNKGGLVDKAGSSFQLASPSSRVVIVRDGNGVSIHSIADEDELAHVSKSEINKDVPGSNLSLNLKADNGDDGVGSNLQDTIVDVSTLVHCLLKYWHYFSSILYIIFLTDTLL